MLYLLPVVYAPKARKAAGIPDHAPAATEEKPATELTRPRVTTGSATGKAPWPRERGRQSKDEKQEGSGRGLRAGGAPGAPVCGREGKVSFGDENSKSPEPRTQCTAAELNTNREVFAILVNLE